MHGKVVLGEIGDMFVVVSGHNSSQSIKVGMVLGHNTSQIMKTGDVFVVLLGQVLMTNSKFFEFLLVNLLSMLQAVLKTSPMDHHGSAES
jgi:membrane protein CcdC involved in cytochrome C biogenesis